MKINIKEKVLIALLSFFVMSFSGQNKNFESFNQDDLESYRISDDKYNFWWYKNDNIWFHKSDTLPYLVDDSMYKGLINYGLEFSLVERKNFSYTENFEMYKLKIKIESCKAFLNDDMVEITGVIEGGWSNNRTLSHKKQGNHVDVFIGKTVDTIKTQHLNNLFNPEKITTTYRGEKINHHVILDTFPAKYIHTYKHLRTESGSNRKFKIKSKIDKNSVLVFGLTSCYVELYEIGELVFSNDSQRRKKIKKSADMSFYPKIIISDNIHKNNNFNTVEEAKPEYYKITEKAENYILLRQYAKAKEIYNNLLDNAEYIFARDIHNAIRCAIKSRDYKTAIFWCKKLILKGISLAYFDEDIFIPLKKIPLWKQFLIEYDSLNEQFKKGLNENLINGIQKLVEKDQEYYIKNSKGEIVNMDLAKITEEVDQAFISLIKKEGFPTEEKIGVITTKNNTIDFTPPFFVLLIHSYKTRSNKQNEVKELFNKNKLYYDAYRNDLSVFKKNGMTCLQIYKGNLYNAKSCGSNLAAVQKMKFIFNNEYNFIIDAGEYSIIPFEDHMEKEDEKFIKDNFDFVTKLTDDWLFYE